MNPLINLQNTPTSSKVVLEKVAFTSEGVELSGIVFKPADAAGRIPGAVVTGAWTMVKEQMVGTYARELAARGLVALAFDFTGWGESAGEPRFVENPTVKTADIVAAATYMTTRDDVEANSLLGLGICASSGYMTAAVADLRFATIR